MSNQFAQPRTYRKRRRAEQEAATRLRITKAAVDLHGSIGPARTTISAVAERAGVQRATVYRHFPDEAALFQSCSAHWARSHPAPDPATWTAIRDPSERLRTALDQVYEFYEGAEPMFSRTRRDAAQVESVRPLVQAFEGYLEWSREVLVRGRPQRGAKRRRVKAAIGHGLAFESWRSLALTQGLSRAEAIALMEGTVEAAGA